MAQNKCLLQGELDSPSSDFWENDCIDVQAVLSINGAPRKLTVSLLIIISWLKDTTDTTIYGQTHVIRHNGHSTITHPWSEINACHQHASNKVISRNEITNQKKTVMHGKAHLVCTFITGWIVSIVGHWRLYHITIVIAGYITNIHQ